MIAQQSINRVLEEARVEDVVGEFVTLKKRGANLMGLCPFHNEKTPSFVVSPAKNIYKCFGCGQSGNPVKFLMEQQQMGFTEAIRYLAKRYGIELEETQTSEKDKEEQDARESIFIANGFAARFYNAYLKTDEGRSVGNTYFRERGLSEATIEKFQLGYAPDSFDALLKEAIKEQYNLDVLQKAALLVKRDEKQFDFFRNRVMFPIHNVAGKIAGFGGRILKKDEKSPKYINTPENEVYNKSQILYGLYQGRVAIRKQDECLLTEGYMDVIALHQAGIENAVASSGTSLTTGQARLIKRYTDNVCVIYDSDKAGIKAALRGIDILLENDLNVRVLSLPDEDDPDSYLRKEGAEAFKNYMADNRQDFILFKTRLSLSEVKDDPVKRAELIRDIVQSISLINDTIKRSEYLKECARLLNVNEQILIAESNKVRRQKKNDAFKQAEKESSDLPQFNEIDAAIHREQSHMSGRFSPDIYERDFLRMILDYQGVDMEDDRSVMDYLTDELTENDFQNQLYRQIWLGIKTEWAEHGRLNLSNWLQHADTTVSELLIDIATQKNEVSPNWYEMHKITIASKQYTFFQDISSTIIKHRLFKNRQLIMQNMETLKNTNDEAERTKYMMVHQALKEREKELAQKLGIEVIGWFRQ